MWIDHSSRRRLLTLARRALEARVAGQALPHPESGGVLDEPRGAFVTIRRSGELRGCLGRIAPHVPLAETVADLGASVADSDPRFHPVARTELDDIDVEISVLTPEYEVQSLDQIETGRHGVIVELGYRKGLLLPQVATEQGWDAETFVSQTCRKAGLPADAWKNGAKIYVFEAEVFCEVRRAGPADAP
jgi:AmmeMemoRadiSam system protein A